VERWRDSGLTAEQFAGELGINAGTLKFWATSSARRAGKLRQRLALRVLNGQRRQLSSRFGRSR
jgi:hypothetical protein